MQIRSSVSLGACPSLGVEIISIHRIMIYWKLRKMLKGKQGLLICCVSPPGQEKSRIFKRVSIAKLWLILSLKILKILVNTKRAQGSVRTGEAGEYVADCV